MKLYESVFNELKIKNNTAKEYFKNNFFKHQNFNQKKLNEILLNKYNIYHIKNGKEILYNKNKYKTGLKKIVLYKTTNGGELQLPTTDCSEIFNTYTGFDNNTNITKINENIKENAFEDKEGNFYIINRIINYNKITYLILIDLRNNICKINIKNFAIDKHKKRFNIQELENALLQIRFTYNFISHDKLKDFNFQNKVAKNYIFYDISFNDDDETTFKIYLDIYQRNIDGKYKSIMKKSFVILNWYYLFIMIYNIKKTFFDEIINDEIEYLQEHIRFLEDYPYATYDIMKLLEKNYESSSIKSLNSELVTMIIKPKPNDKDKYDEYKAYKKSIGIKDYQKYNYFEVNEYEDTFINNLDCSHYDTLDNLQKI